MKNEKAFTLIELLIVVAIIAILAAIALPNFLEAQTRAKVSRVKSDLRTVSMALQAYYVDNNHYTRDSDCDLDREFEGAYELKANGITQLTTPIAFLTSMPRDPFMTNRKDVTGGDIDNYFIGSGSWSYRAELPYPPDNQYSFDIFEAAGPAAACVVFSSGPDRITENGQYKCFPYERVVGSCGEQDVCHYIDYDPTNGTVSYGDVMRFSGSFMAGNWARTISLVRGGHPMQPEVP